MAVASSRIWSKDYILLYSLSPCPLNLTIGEEIGRGAYSVVYKGLLDDRPVAVKTIHNLVPDSIDSSADDDLGELDKKCGRMGPVLTSIGHSHIVETLGAFYDKEKQEPIIVMELMSTDLRTFIKHNKGLPTSNQLQICLQIALGVHFLHHLTPPIVHGDLNDKNVLLAEDGTVKLGDLGQSKHKGMQHVYSGSKVPGNLFMPPEATGNNPHYTKSVDVFSIGVLAVEVTTQSPPSPSIGTVEEVERRAADLAKMGNSHPSKPLVLKCLQNNYKDRPDIDQVLSELYIQLVIKRKSQLLTLTQDRDRFQKDKSVLIEQLARSQSEFESRMNDVRAEQKQGIEKLKKENYDLRVQLRRCPSEYEQTLAIIEGEHKRKKEGALRHNEKLADELRECKEELDAKLAVIFADQSEEREKYQKEKDCLEEQLEKRPSDYERKLTDIKDGHMEEKLKTTKEIKNLVEQVDNLRQDLEKKRSQIYTDDANHDSEMEEITRKLSLVTAEKDKLSDKLMKLKRSLESMVFQKRTVLLLGHKGVGKSLVANKLLGLSDKEGGFKVGSDHTALHPSQNTVIMWFESVLYGLTVVNTHDIWDEQWKILQTSEVESLKRYLQMTSPTNVNLVLFLYTKNDHFTGKVKKCFDYVMQDVLSPATSDVSALVITHCDDLDDEARKATVDEFKRGPTSQHVANFMKKGIYTVGYCDVTDEDHPLREQYEELMEEDTDCLRHLISASFDTLSGYELFRQ